MYIFVFTACVTPQTKKKADTIAYILYDFRAWFVAYRSKGYDKSKSTCNVCMGISNAEKANAIFIVVI